MAKYCYTVIITMAQYVVEKLETTSESTAYTWPPTPVLTYAIILF